MLRAGRMVWRAGTAGTGAVVLGLDDDGTARLRDAAGQVVWTS
ncbi:MAG: hypothetical protein CMH83_05820 [Nocardioides sp.]|nr:hypothetical protein [Nocardioides sp.]